MNDIIKLYIDENTYKRNNSNNITGVIFFKINDYFFPENGWFDFPIIVINWWMESLRDIMISNEKRELNFMDGPASVVIKILERPMCSVEFIWDKTIEFTTNIDIETIYNEVFNVARDLEIICKKNNWNDDEIIKMRKFLSI